MFAQFYSYTLWPPFSFFHQNPMSSCLIRVKAWEIWGSPIVKYCSMIPINTMTILDYLFIWNQIKFIISVKCNYIATLFCLLQSNSSQGKTEMIHFLISAKLWSSFPPVLPSCHSSQHRNRQCVNRDCHLSLSPPNGKCGFRMGTVGGIALAIAQDTRTA